MRDGYSGVHRGKVSTPLALNPLSLFLPIVRAARGGHAFFLFDRDEIQRAQFYLLCVEIHTNVCACVWKGRKSLECISLWRNSQHPRSWLLTRDRESKKARGRGEGVGAGVQPSHQQLSSSLFSITLFFLLMAATSLPGPSFSRLILFSTRI